MNSPQRPDGPPVRDGKPYSQIAHLAESVAPFVAIDGALRAQGISAPEILAEDIAQGILLIENLGSDGMLDETGAPILQRYTAAARLLAKIHTVEWPRDDGCDRQIDAQRSRL